MRLPLQFPGLLIASLLVLLSSDGIAAEYDLQVIEHETPARLDQLENVDVLLVLMNRGDRPWTPDRFNVSYHWLAPDGETIVFDGLRTPIPERVDPGEALELTVRLQSPPSTGPALLQWDVVEESVTWISERDPTPPEPIPVTIEPAELEHAFSLLSESTPHIIWADDTSEVGLKLRNDGAATWGPGRKINVSYHWKHPSEAKAVFEGMRTPVPGVISEGEHLEIEARLRSPRRAGIYELQWDMVEEGVTWFQRVDPSPPPPVTVLVLPNPLTGPTVATAAAIICLSIVAFVFYRRGVPSRVIDVAVVLDLVWLFFALSAKQSVVLQEAGRSPIEGSGWIVISGVAAITIVVALFPSRLRPWIAAGVNAVASFVILADVIHIRFFRDMLSFASIGAAHQMGEISSGIASLFASRDLWLFIDLVPGIALALLVRRLASESRRRYARWPALLLVPLLLPGIVVATRIGTAEKGKFVQTFQNIFIVQEIGPLNYHLLDAWRETASALSSPELTETRREQIIEWFEKTSDRRAGVGEMFGRARGKNLLMIQAESMQGFVIGLEVEGQEITPNLNHWSRSNAIWLSNCADQTAQGRTSDAEFAIHTSLIPPRQGTVAFRHGDNRYVGLADVLHDHGYSTLSAIPFDRAFWNRRVTLPEYGYHTNLFRGDFEPGLNVGWGLNDRAFLEQMVPKLVALDRPFAALLITLSNHHPYAHFPQELKVLDLG
ncbi:MAG: LTA synthase family protein, partial [Thermoanaerobaculia bacterium]|nr:LTA synthase family protein [Thermoanaerobaculia bacterium]